MLLRLIITSIFLLSGILAYSQSLVDYNIFKYKISGDVKSVIEIEYTGDNKTDTIDCPKVLNYGKNGRLIKASYCYVELYYEYTYEYDEKGNVIYENTPYDRNENKFDDNGNLIEHKLSVTENDYFGKWIYKYDENNNQIERIGYIGDDFVERWIHKYDQNNRRVEEIMVYVNSDSIADIKRIFEYDDSNNIKSQLFISYSEGKQEQWETKYKYNKFNNVIEYIEIDNEGDIKKTIYKYKYDSNGNWIYKTCSENGIVKSIFERKIEYK